MRPEVYLFGGTYGHNGDRGKPSGYIQRLVEVMYELDECELFVQNGGKYEELEKAVKHIPHGSDVTLMWFPNISNDVAKLLPYITASRDDLKLVISKNNLIGKYNDEDLRIRRETAQAVALVEFYPIDHGFGAGIHTDQGVTKGFDSPQDLARNILGALR